MKDKTKQILAFVLIDTILAWVVLWAGIFLYVSNRTNTNLMIMIICSISFAVIKMLYLTKLDKKWYGDL